MLAQVAEQFVWVRRGKREQRVVPADAKTPRLIAASYPEQVVRMIVLER